MRLYGQGQNIVQAGGNTGGSMAAAAAIAGRYFDRKARLEERAYNRREDTLSRKELITHQTNEKIRGNLIEGLMSPHIMGNIFDYAGQEYGADHPDVVSGKRMPTDKLRPELHNLIKNYGVVSTKNGILPGTPGKGKAYFDALEDYNREKKNKSDEVEARKGRVDTSGVIASSPIGGNAPRKDDIEMALATHNTKNTFPFESTVGGSGKWSPTSFNEDQTPTYSEYNAEESMKDIKNTPSPKQRAKESTEFAGRSADLYKGSEEGK